MEDNLLQLENDITDEISFPMTKGEELRKQIGAAAYIECSSKTQQIPWPKPPTKWDDFCVL
ncbi:hypothetical protein ISN45_Aa07g006040 [Arabidopsis thaliana x Arabidopsis arenosa]|uniref:Uncharacterized protein n=1 Tax=Arabidopsis thaliana x Arabidopsis arenosa TaxID=1240361 RepID=A0A8T1Y1W4_9BRAS|nr:hypothetical protein ISN45_Aa07g006040 [Arabidopsis thaliana x Arabidopsis arenosa]